MTSLSAPERFCRNRSRPDQLSQGDRRYPDAAGIRIPAWYLLLVSVLGILSRCESLRDLERFARRNHAVLSETLSIELKRPPSDSAFRCFVLQVDVSSICAAIRDWTLAQIPGNARDLD